MPTSQSIWNALLTVLGVALLACLGWQMSEITKLKEKSAAESVTEFTEEEANDLRRELTTIMTNIDMRLTLIERDIEWIKILPGLRQSTQNLNADDKPSPPQPAPPQAPPKFVPPSLSEIPDDSPTQQAPTPHPTLKYDLRKSR